MRTARKLSPFIPGATMRLTILLVPDRSPRIRRNSEGKITELSGMGRAVLVNFPEGPRWCWPKELEIVT